MHGLLKRPERRQVLCRVPSDEARVAAVAADVDRHGTDETAGQVPQQVHQEPGEEGAAGQSNSIHGWRARSSGATLAPNSR